MTDHRRPLTLILAALAVVSFACSDSGAKDDLPTEDQSLDQTEVKVGVMPDGWPNPAHKCMTFDAIVVGFWATTDRIAIWIYNDHACKGANLEADMTVMNGVPRSVVNSGG